MKVESSLVNLSPFHRWWSARDIRGCDVHKVLLHHAPQSVNIARNVYAPQSVNIARNVSV